VVTIIDVILIIENNIQKNCVGVPYESHKVTFGSLKYYVINGM